MEGLQRPHSLPAPLPLAQTKNAAVVRCLSRTAQPSPRPHTRSHTLTTTHAPMDSPTLSAAADEVREGDGAGPSARKQERGATPRAATRISLARCSLTSSPLHVRTPPPSRTAWAKSWRPRRSCRYVCDRKERGGGPRAPRFPLPHKPPPLEGCIRLSPRLGLSHALSLPCPSHVTGHARGRPPGGRLPAGHPPHPGGGGQAGGSPHADGDGRGVCGPVPGRGQGGRGKRRREKRER